MRKSIASLAESPELFASFTPKKFQNPFPDFTLEEKLSPKLVGYARLLAKISFQKKSYSLSLSDEYLAKLWSDENQISRSSVQRRLAELQKSGVILISTSAPEKLPDGSFRQKRTIHLIPIKEEQKKKFSPCVSEMTHQKIYFSKEKDRTIQEEGKKESSFINTQSLKKIEPEKKQKPDELVKRLQKSFLKKAIERITEEDQVDYRFACLILRTCFGADDKTIGYYSSNLHLQLSHKPEILLSALELMVKSYSGIRKPIGFLIAEIQASLGKEKRIRTEKKSVSQESLPLPLPNRDAPMRKRRNLEELQRKFDQIRREKLSKKEEASSVDLPITKPKKDFKEVLQVLRSPRGL